MAGQARFSSTGPFIADYGTGGDRLADVGAKMLTGIADPNAAMHPSAGHALLDPAGSTGSGHFAAPASLEDGSGMAAEAGSGDPLHFPGSFPAGVVSPTTDPASVKPDLNGLQPAGSLLETVDAAISDRWNHVDDGSAGGRASDVARTPAAARRSEADASREAQAAAWPGTDGDTPAAAEAGMQSLVLAATAVPTVFEKRVAASLDDVEQAASGSMSVNSGDLELTTDGSKVQTVGMRFTGIDIPKGAIITNAYIQFTVDTVTTGAASLMVRGEDADDAAAFTTAGFNASSRPVTDAAVAWQPAVWTVRGEAGLAQRTPDLTAVVQEIVDRSGWAALNDMVFLITGSGTRTARAYDSRPDAAPLLHVEYEMPLLGDPVVFDAPADSNPAANQIAELAAAGTQVGITASASDPDAADTVTYGIDDPRFAIDPNTGVVTRSGTGTLDFETGTSITLTVTATSSDRSTATQSYTLGVLDSPEPVAFNTPADADMDVNRIIENAAAGTRVGVTASARDPDAGSTVTWSVDDPRFAIDAAGIITRSGTGTLNSQSQPSITLTVTATSSDGSTATQTFGLVVASSTTPTVFEKRVASSLDDVEQAASGAMSVSSGDLELTTDGSKVQTVGMRFTGIDIPEGAIITRAYIQFAVDTVTTGAASLMVRGEDADDAAAFTTAGFNASSRPATDAAVAWQPAAWTVLGEAGLAQRTPDLTAVVQEIVDRSGWAALNDMVFLITGSGTRTARAYDSRPDAAPLLHVEYEMPLLGDPVVFDAPADSNPAANQIAELAAAGTQVGITASASDPDAADTVTYGIDDPRFAIDPNTGVVTRSGTGTLDFETGTSITLTVTATSSDRSTATQSYTLGVLDSPEPVAFNTPADADMDVNRIIENAAAGTRVGVTASARDPDAGSTVTWSVDDPRFAIDAAGIITRSGTGTLNSQSQPSITLTVTATSSDGSTATQTFGLVVASSTTPTVFEKRVASSLDDVEQAASGAMSVSSGDLELTTDGSKVQTVGMRFTGIDIPEGAIITRAYIQFAVDTVTTGAASLMVRGEDADDAAAFTTAGFNASSRPATDAAVAWQPAAWTVLGEAGLAQRTPDLTAVVQEIVDRSGWAALNDMVFLITGSGTRTARAYDSRPDAAPLLHVEYHVLPPSDPVVFNSPADSNPAANQIAELAAAGTQVGITASASDPDAGASVTYSIDDPRFSIGPATGVITRSGTGTLDFETGNPITLTVTATSSDRSTATQSYTLGILDSPEPVAFDTPADADTTANRIVQSAAAGTRVGVTASARDPDAGSTVTWSVDDPRFAIDAAGVITRSGTGTLNAQSQPSVALTVTATSSDGSQATRDFNVNVLSQEGPQTILRFAAFGDYGDTNLAGEKAVAALVKSWNVDFILTVGDNVYAPQTLDNAVGQQFHDYIGGYHGSYGAGSAVNRFFPALGNHEYNEGFVAGYLDYFALPDNERYYDFQVGPVHFFAINSNKQEEDDRDASSVQAQWMESVLADSDASFNVAYLHHTPFNPSGDTTTMRWPHENWGVDAVFAGHEHNYYRENRDDNGDGRALPYTTTGLGGAGEEVPDVGASLVTITDTGMLIEFYQVSSFNGTTLTSVRTDSYFVPTPAGRAPTTGDGEYVLNGTNGADYLWGLGNNATLNGGPGNDTLIGGNNHNLFVVHAGDDADTIVNFRPGAGTTDVLDLRAFGIQSAASFRQIAVDQASNVVANLGNGDQLVLLGVQESQFHDDNFLDTDLLLV